MHRTILLLCLLQLTIGGHLSAQDGRFQIAAHAGVLEDGRGLLGGQIGVRIARPVTATLSGTEVLDVGAGAYLRNWEAFFRRTLAAEDPAILPWRLRVAKQRHYWNRRVR